MPICEVHTHVHGVAQRCHPVVRQVDDTRDRPRHRPPAPLQYSRTMSSHSKFLMLRGREVS